VEKKVKITVVLAVSLIAIGALVLVPPVLAEDEIIDADGDSQRGKFRRCLKCNLGVAIYILTNGVPEEISGEVSVLVGQVLILEDDGGLVNVNLPWKWVIDGEVYTAKDLFDGEPFGTGDEATVKSLMVELEEESHTVTVYFSYELNVEGTKATAVIPFNIKS
jgi:hypothetical protein